MEQKPYEPRLGWGQPTQSQQHVQAQPSYANILASGTPPPPANRPFGRPPFEYDDLREKAQVPWAFRALYFLFVGWWLTLIWTSFAQLAMLLVIGVPLAAWMWDHTNAVMTLRNGR